MKYLKNIFKESMNLKGQLGRTWSEWPFQGNSIQRYCPSGPGPLLLW